jgi:hypothetical protein
MRITTLIGSTVGAVALVACAGSPTTTVTVTETATTLPSPTQSEAIDAAPSDVAPAPEADVVVVADMVGQNYQDAQDVWRASGLVVVPAEDATGANRLAVLDSNWYVVSQSPAGGSEVPTGTSIQASIRKYTDG